MRTALLDLKQVTTKRLAEALDDERLRRRRFLTGIDNALSEQRRISRAIRIARAIAEEQWAAEGREELKVQAQQDVLSRWLTERLL